VGPAGLGQRRSGARQDDRRRCDHAGAYAALRSIVRRDTGETYQAFLTQLAQTSGIATPTCADLVRVDRKRPKKGGNIDRTHPHDPDAHLTKMKDGRTHLAHKAEHAVDTQTDAVVAVTLHGADQGDTTTMQETVPEAAAQLAAAANTAGKTLAIVETMVADKEYHRNQPLVDLTALGVRTYSPNWIADAGGGATSAPRVRPSTPIGAASAERAASR
jgi:transposase